MLPYHFMLTFTFFFIFYIIETIYPSQVFVRTHTNRFQHTYRNIFLAVVNVVFGFAFSGITLKVFQLVQEQGFGLMRLPFWTMPVNLLLAFLLFDLWMYIWHRMNHEIFILWRLHRVHHTDEEMDATTALRFHPIEIFISNILNLGVFLLIGIPQNIFLFYKLISTVIIVFHHSNMKINPRLDKFLRFLIVTPNMHRVHHSEIFQETNSNYASLFSFWDRLFKTYRQRDDIGNIQFGIGYFKKARWHNTIGLLLTPFHKK